MKSGEWVDRRLFRRSARRIGILFQGPSACLPQPRVGGSQRLTSYFNIPGSQTTRVPFRSRQRANLWKPFCSTDKIGFRLALAGQSSVPRRGVGGAESRIVLHPTSGNPQPHPSAATNSLHYRIQCLTQHRPAVANPLDFLRPKFDGMAVDNAAAADHRGN